MLRISCQETAILHINNFDRYQHTIFYLIFLFKLMNMNLFDEWRSVILIFCKLNFLFRIYTTMQILWIKLYKVAPQKWPTKQHQTVTNKRILCKCQNKPIFSTFNLHLQWRVQHHLTLDCYRIIDVTGRSTLQLRHTLYPSLFLPLIDLMIFLLSDCSDRRSITSNG